MIRNDGPLKDLVVIDALGQSLLPKDAEATQRHFDFGYTSAAYVLGQVPLKRLDRPGKVIRTLRGVAPVAIAARRPDPLLIPLERAEGRTFRSVESVVKVVRVAKIVPKMAVEIVQP